MKVHSKIPNYSMCRRNVGYIPDIFQHTAKIEYICSRSQHICKSLPGTVDLHVMPTYEYTAIINQSVNQSFGFQVIQYHNSCHSKIFVIEIRRNPLHLFNLCCSDPLLLLLDCHHIRPNNRSFGPLSPLACQRLVPEIHRRVRYYLSSKQS